MAVRDLATVALRLYALFLLIDNLLPLKNLFFHWFLPSQSIAPPFDRIILVGNSLFFLIYVSVAIVLLRFSRTIADYMTPQDSKVEGNQFDYSALLRVGLCLVGAVFLVYGIKDFAYGGSMWYFIRGDIMSVSRPDLAMDYKSKMVEGCIVFVAGLLLFMGRARLVRLARGIKTLGVMEPETNRDLECTQAPKDDDTHEKP
jgi:hypothetical protein